MAGIPGTGPWCGSGGGHPIVTAGRCPAASSYLLHGVMHQRHMFELSRGILHVRVQRRPPLLLPRSHVERMLRRVLGACAIAGCLVATPPAAAQTLVVDLAVVSNRSPHDSLPFRLIAKRSAVDLPGPARAAQPRERHGDTLWLTTPIQFSVDLSQGEVLLLSSSATWLKVDLVDSYGTMQASASKLRLRKHADSHIIEIRGIP